MTAPQQFEDDHHVTRKIDWSLWRRILANMRPYPLQIVLMATSGTLLAASEITLPLLTAVIVDQAIAGESTTVMWWYAAAYLGILMLFAGVVWVFINTAGRLATGVAFDVRGKAFARLQTLPFAYFDRRSSGWLVSRVTSDVTKICEIMPWLLLDLAWGSVMFIGIVGTMLVINVQLGIAIAAVVPPLVIATWWFKRRMLESSRRIRRANSRITAGYNEMIGGVRTTRMLVREDLNLDEFEVLTGEMRSWSVRNALQSAVYLPVVMSLGSIGVGIALWRGGVQIESDTGLTIGILIAFMQYAVLLAEPIRELAQRFVDLQTAQAAAERVQGLLDETPAIRDKPEVAAAIEAQVRNPDDSAAEDGGIQLIERLEFKDVSHAYDVGEPVLHDINFQVNRGMTIALVGPTGGGKSTIVSLLARWYEPTRGHILVNDIDYRQRGLDWWQSQFGVVQQVPHLFSGSIRENIRYGRLEATDQEILEALDRVNGTEFVTELPQGLEFDVGESGQRLSTGQRQLIALARAVLADPQIFIMDEATSSVDTQTEAKIQAAIDSVLQGRIAFVIAHRLSTIRDADRVMVVENGRILESGSHDTLIKAGGRYHALYTAQYIEDQEAKLMGSKPR
ncbi:MAG: ABC transporter ATP-binding protein/permease [Phycisphaerales bacterium]|nr:ABC transporter ATP-binding protein/permease [Phycisphaerales bacterium]